VIVRFTAEAQNVLDAAMIYIATKNPYAVEPFIKRIENAKARLCQFPESGSFIPEFPDADYRQIFARPYRLFYRIVDDEVIIVAVYHDKQIPHEPEVE